MKNALHVGGDLFTLLLTSVLLSASSKFPCFFSNLNKDHALFLIHNIKYKLTEAQMLLHLFFSTIL